MALTFAYSYNGRTYTVHLEPQPDGTYTARLGDNQYTVRAVPGPEGGLLLDWGDGRAVTFTARSGDARYVHVNGQHYALSTVDPSARRRKGAGPGGDLAAAMPGRVVDVLVNTGDRVEAGQTLVILEAMKMEIRVTAPGDGVVRLVTVKPEDVVASGETLVELDTEESAGNA